jgi:8-amino-3,8-dideoxy-alpha-D-manno-octulosonate transaminase
MHRRKFFIASAAVAGSAAATSAHAADDNTPIRKTRLQTGYYGTQYYDENEQKELIDVVQARSPFRWYGPGKQPPSKVLSFEREFASRMRVPHALAVTSGTAALQTAMAALGIGPGDEVILPAWTWYSCYNAIVLAGALPVFAEIDESLNLDPTDLEGKITPQTKAILAVHHLGASCDMDGILSVAGSRKIKLLEDCAQSMGATYKGRPVGTMGDIGIYSMQINKTITSGEGGAVVTHNPELFERAARFHDLGLLRPPHEQAIGGAKLSPFAGSQFRMSEFTGGVLRAQLRKLDQIVGSLRENARRVREGVRDLTGLRFRPLADADGELGSAVYFTFRSKDSRNRFLKAMSAENVPASAPSGSVVLPLQPYIAQKTTVHPAWPSFSSERGRSIAYGPECCPRTIAILDRCAGVTIGPKNSRGDTDDIIAAIRKVYPAVARK